MRGHPRIPQTNPMRDPGDKRGALQGGHRRISLRPKRRTPSGIRNRKGERHSTVRQGNPAEPVTNLNGPSGRPYLREHLQRVQGTTGLTFGCAQVGLKPPPIPTIRVPIPIHSGKHSVRAHTPSEKLKPTPVNQPPMRGEERSSSLEINSHTPSLTAPPQKRLNVSDVSPGTTR
jgi:hypothetical protein